MNQENKKQNIPLVCTSPICGTYAWTYTGEKSIGMYTGCPRCKKNVRIVLPVEVKAE